MVFKVRLNQAMFLAFAHGDVAPLVTALKKMLDIAPERQWTNFVRQPRRAHPRPVRPGGLSITSSTSDEPVPSGVGPLRVHASDGCCVRPGLHEVYFSDRFRQCSRKSWVMIVWRWSLPSVLLVGQQHLEFRSGATGQAATGGTIYPIVFDLLADGNEDLRVERNRARPCCSRSESPHDSLTGFVPPRRSTNAAGDAKEMLEWGRHVPQHD